MRPFLLPDFISTYLQRLSNGEIQSYIKRHSVWFGIGIILLVGGLFQVSSSLAEERVVYQKQPIVQTSPQLASSLLYVFSAPHNNSQELFSGVGGSAPEPSLMAVQGTAILSHSSPLTIATSSNNRQGVITYTVKSGDIPSVIAASFGITTNTLLWANDLSEGQYIQPGDKLTILSTSGLVHTVLSGDTLSSIALQYKGDVQSIIAYNGLSQNGFIRAGQKIVVPDGEIPQRTYARTLSSTYNNKDLGGYFIRPASGRISQRLHPTNAVDIADSCWTPIFSSAEGYVVIADGYGWNGGYGKYVRLRHPNGVETVYAHAIKVTVSAGQQVKQGELLAYMGSTGRSTGCHLHWEVWGAKNPLI